MSDNLYTAEIAALIAGKIYANTDHLLRIHKTIETNHNSMTLPSICAEAGSIFDEVEVLIKNKYANPVWASELYADSLLDVLLSGRVPTHIDMVLLTAQSLQNAS